MSKFTFNNKYITKSADTIVDVIKTKFSEDGHFTGTGQSKKYVVNRSSSTALYYTGFARNQSKQEEIDIEELKTAIEEMKKLPDFTTSTVLLKERIPGNLYRLRTPLFGILAHAEIIVAFEEKEV